jgi:hypothetical protein
MSDLITVKQVMEIVGLDGQPAAHAWLKKHGVPKIKDGARTFVKKSDVNVALLKAKDAPKSDGKKGFAAKAAEHVRPGDPDLITIKEAMELTGHKHQASISQWLDKFSLKQKIDGRVYVSRTALLEAKDSPTPPAAVRVEKKAKPNPFKPFEGNPSLVLWDKGKYRGWAVAAVEDVSATTVKLLTDYGKQYMWPHESVAKSIAAGEFFMVEPAQVMQFLAVQLLRVKDGHADMPGVIKEVLAVAEKLQAIKLDLTKVEVPESKIADELELDLEDEDLGVADGDSESI